MAINDTMGGPNRLRRAAEPTARRSGTRAVLFWAFALVAGLGTALMIARYMDKGGQAKVTLGGVVVAAVDLPLAAKLKIEDLKVIEWPADHIPPGAVADPKEVVGRVLISRVIAQQPLLPGMLAAKNAGSGLAALIPPNMRAIAVRVDDVVGVAGFIHADDRVDVMVTLRPTYQGAEATTKVFLQNVKVLAVGQEVDNGDKTRLHATLATVATLLVSPQRRRAAGARADRRAHHADPAQLDRLGSGGNLGRQPVGPGRRRTRRPEGCGAGRGRPAASGGRTQGPWP